MILLRSAWFRALIWRLRDIAKSLRSNIQRRIELGREILKCYQCGEFNDGVVVEMVLEARHQPGIHFVFGDGSGIGQGCLDALIE